MTKSPAAVEMNASSGLAVVIPLAPKEMAWTRLLCDLRSLPPGSEIILVGTHGPV